jgi:CheY-like chemotaxis protein
VIDDTGPGIENSRLTAIFNEFEQANALVSQSHGGTGLGLAIVKRLVRLMDGSIEVVSEPGQGSSFRVFLPLLAADDATPSGRSPDWQGQSYIVVSASRFGSAVLKSALEEARARVCVAGTVPEAARLLNHKAVPDGILIDHALGPDEARKLAQIARKAGIKQIIIVLSPLERRSFGPPHAAGFTGFLVKPVRPRSLYRRLGESEFVVDDASANEALLVERTSPVRRLRVLVAEDNDINALLITRTLEKMGCEPVLARDGRSALDRAEASLSGNEPAFDLVLLDVRMPGLDGLSTARLIRAAELAAGKESRLPILAVSANVMEDDRRAALAAGMDDCLGKPLDREALAHWITILASKRSAA